MNTFTVESLAVFSLLVSCVLTAPSPAAPVPIFELAQPFWLNVCGVTDTAVELLEEELFAEEISWHEQLARSTNKLHYQLKNARDLLVHKSFDRLYVEVRRGVLDRQYIPNWVPSKGDVEALLATETLTVNEVARYLPGLLRDLQKFAVAFEQVFKDEYRSYEHTPREEALQELIGTLRQLLCEVESALWSLDLSYGPAVSRSLMSSEERDISDYTHRMVRDNGIIIKYRDFLSGWNQLLRIKQMASTFKKYRLTGKTIRKEKRKKSMARDNIWA